MTSLWGSALDRLSSKVARQNFEMWLQPIECRRVEGSTIYLRAPNPYVRLWFESNYLDIVLDELRSDTMTEYAVEFEPEPEQTPAAAAATADTTAAATAASAKGADDSVAGGAGARSGAGAASGGRGAGGVGVASERAKDKEGRGAPLPCTLNPRYTFDAFVAGPSNQLAFAAAEAASSGYPPKYNPVFICGGVGLGKTHLLHAIGHQVRRHQPDARIMYLSGERFMNEYIHAIRTNHMHEFRHRYREGCEVLLVDDVQFLAGKDGTQDEFFHTFNALHDAHRQIVLTADRKPHEISDIADRLRSRFAWGLMADIEAPELEVRVAILRKKAEAEGIHLPDEVALYIAAAIKSNVRELEGALIRLAAFASLSSHGIDMDFARRTLEGSLTRPRERLTTEAIIKAVAGYYGLKVSDIKSGRRHKAIAGPRAVAMYLARTHTSDSYPDLGRAFGGKHHTTVLSAVDKITHKRDSDPGLCGEIQAVESLILR
jgi:chromosomal replication initiator protein